MDRLYLAIPFVGLAALIFALIKAKWIGKQEVGTDEMAVIAGHIREGAMAFLGREYKVLGIFVASLGVLLIAAYWGSAQSHPLIAVSFVVGAVCSGLAGYFGMRVATMANVRTSNAARTSLTGALKVAFSGGSVMGMSVVGLGVLGLSTLFILYSELFGEVWTIDRLLAVLSGFSLGASSIALFARVGGGVYTKAADVGADLVGKVEAGIPEDDPRNPAVIADNVGDNVGDVAGMGADLFESYVGAIIGAMVLGASWVVVGGDGQNGPVMLPLVLAAVGILVSILATLFVRTREGGNPQHALNFGIFGAAAIMLVATLGIVYLIIPEPIVMADRVLTPLGAFGAVVTGLIAGVLVGLAAEYYTSESKAPVRRIANDAQTGSATCIISGLATGMVSTAAPLLFIAIAILLAYYSVGHLYGVALAALGMLSTTGIQLSVDAYGPIADNAGGISQMAGLEKEVRERTDKLDAVGNTTAAIGKGFAIASAALTALALFSAYSQQVGLAEINVLSPNIMAGVLVGAMLPFLFSAFAMRAVGEAAFEMVQEVRRQFREIPGLMEGKATAEYAKCVDISTKAAIRRMVLPGTLAVAVPVAVGLMDPSGGPLGGLLVGVTASGVVLAIFMANAGGAWDNAKKYIESGAFGGKNSDAHKAAVVGDTVGDPFKDTAGPSLNILIKLMSVVALVMAPLLLSLQGEEAGNQTAVAPITAPAEAGNGVVGDLEDDRQSAAPQMEIPLGGEVLGAESVVSTLTGLSMHHQNGHSAPVGAAADGL